MIVVNTVLGQIPAQQLGITLSHEHLFTNPGHPELYQDSVLTNMHKIIQEAALFRAAGGETIVEMTPLNFGRNVTAYREISRATGIQVICATGFHKEEFIPAWFQTKSNREIIDLLMAEINRGVANTGIRPGVIKIGTSYKTISSTERRAIEIAAFVQKETSLPISSHCDQGTMAIDQADLFVRLGVQPEKVVLGHVDIPNDAEYLKKICSLGFNVGIDHIGRDMTLKDIVKIGLIKDVIASGFIDHIMLSGDMGKKSYLKSFGGKPGLGYVLREFKNNMLQNGVKEQEFQHILVDNPRRVFGLALS
ncbi:MAG: aryldialkylphosphatase [Anaerolineales bacterium]|jgi:phosphotriesterase-related protein